RFEKLAENFLAMVKLAMLERLLKALLPVRAKTESARVSESQVAYRKRFALQVNRLQKRRHFSVYSTTECSNFFSPYVRRIIANRPFRSPPHSTQVQDGSDVPGSWPLKKPSNRLVIIRERL